MLKFIVFFHNQNISFIEQGAWKKWHFCSMGLQGAPLCACCFCRYFNVMHWSAIGLLTNSATFFLAPNFINFVISPYNDDYGQWMTTQNVRKKILHALHFKYTIFIKYCSSYIKKCQTGTYFFGWVYIATLRTERAAKLKMLPPPPPLIRKMDRRPCLPLLRLTAFWSPQTSRN